MKKYLMLTFVAFLMLTGFQFAWGESCVEVDIELPATVVAEPGAFATGYFELINCGDEAAVIWLYLSAEINNIPFPLGQIPFYLGAGETFSREFQMPVPPISGGFEATFCVNAVSGDSEASDCATVTIEEGTTGGDGGQITGFMLASETGCVEVDLEFPETIYAAPNSFLEGYFELTNCGDEADMISFSVTLDSELFGQPITVGNVTLPMAAGEVISREFRFPVPPALPEGTFGICVTATSGDAVTTACQTIEIVNDWGGEGISSSKFNLTNSPNPFNPSTSISFELPQAADVNLTIYNILGQEVSTLVSERLSAGAHTFDWRQGLDRNPVSSGIYLYRLRVNDEVISRKMTLLK